jgi:hypothetical protein
LCSCLENAGIKRVNCGAVGHGEEDNKVHRGRTETE